MTAAMSSRAPRAALVLLAAGEGRRAGHGTNKVLMPLAGRPVFTWSIETARAVASVVATVLVVREADRGEIEAVLARDLPDVDVDLVVGGDTRHASEWAALTVLAQAIEAGEIDVVVIHDAARPLAEVDLFTGVIEAADRWGGAIPGREISGLIALAEASAPPEHAVAVQTPQAFAAAPLLAAYRAAEREGFVGTDTASCVEHVDPTAVVACVPGGSDNLKITFPEDLALAERLLAARGTPAR